MGSISAARPAVRLRIGEVPRFRGAGEDPRIDTRDKGPRFRRASEVGLWFGIDVNIIIH